MSEQLLQVRNLSVSVEDKPILHGIDLEVRPGETHVLMGPNGAGKSTLGYTIMGSPRYEVTGGEILFKGKELLYHYIRAYTNMQHVIPTKVPYILSISGTKVIKVICGY